MLAILALGDGRCNRDGWILGFSVQPVCLPGSSRPLAGDVLPEIQPFFVPSYFSLSCSLLYDKLSRAHIAYILNMRENMQVVSL